MRVLIIGCGYVGLPLGRELVRQGHEVFGLHRSAGSELAALGITPLAADITRAETLTGLPRAFDWVINCAATGGGTADDYRQLYLTGNRHLLAWLRETPPQKFLYTSSTSIYGQDDGSLVTEADPATPTAETARVLVETEQLLLAAHRENNFPALIIRLAGIYGPERGYWFKQFLRGEARLDGDGARFLNMIHLTDVVGAIIRMLQHAPAGSIVNGVDAEPVSQRDFFAWLAAKLGQPMPPAQSEDAARIRKRGATNKRVGNQRLKSLGYQYQYPTFREGYAAELERMEKG